MADTALRKAEQNALAVSYDVLGTHVELDLQFVKNYLVRGRAELVSDQEVVFFMNTCKMQRLNPLVQGEVYLIKYSKEEPAQMVVGKDAYLRRAYDHPDYLYKNDGITVQRGDETIQKKGCCLYPGEVLIGGWCEVFFMRNGKERSSFKEVEFREYNKGQANWRSKPATMINKVAISQCVRDAFPKDYEGLYSEDEMVASGAIPTSPENVIDADDTPAEEIFASKEQKQALFGVIRSKFSGNSDAGNQFYMALLEQEGLEQGDGIPLGAYSRMMDKAMALQAASDLQPGRKNTDTVSSEPAGKSEE
mgnify:CR=1 FL=1